MDKFKVRACAKLNLTLDACGVRPDGYHELVMLMQSVDLCDEVELVLTDSGIKVDCGDFSCDNNIAAVAAEKYFQACRADRGAEIKIKKNISVCGGLAGGSADAAAVLVMLDKLLGTVSHDKLLEIAASIGADVPFAMTGGLSLVKGIGEKIEHIKPLPKCTFLLASAGVKDSTGKMFARLDSLGDYPHPDTKQVIDFINSGELCKAAPLFANSFNALWTNDLALEIFGVMREHGAIGCSVSGSGPTIFGVFESDEQAMKCADKLSAVTECHICHPTDKSIFFE